MSGRNFSKSMESSFITSRARAGSVVRPCMTWTKPAASGSPGRSTSTSVPSWNSGSPSKSFSVSCHHAVCSARSLFCWAASGDSKRASAMNVPSSVTPVVLPSHPEAPGASSSLHLSICARSAAASVTRPWITCTNMCFPSRPPSTPEGISTLRRDAGQQQRYEFLRAGPGAGTSNASQRRGHIVEVARPVWAIRQRRGGFVALVWGPWERGSGMGAGDSARNEAHRVRERAARLQRRAEMFDKGADGEARTAKALSRLGRDWVVLHDVQWPGRRLANIDHVVVGPGGIFVIDTKNWAGKLSVEGDVLRQDGRSRERTVAAAADAALAVAELAPAYASLVRPVLCFARDDNLSGWMGDVMICSTSNVRRMLTSRPPVLVSARVKEVATRFDMQLRSATEPRPQAALAASPPAPLSAPASAPARPASHARRTARRRTAGRRPGRALARLLVVTAVTLGAVAAAPTVLPPLGQKFGEFFTSQLAPETDSCVEQPRERAREKQRARDDGPRASARSADPARCSAP